MATSRFSAPNCYCAFCKSPRRVSTKKRLSAINVFLSLFCGAVLTALWFQEFDPRGILFCVMSLVLAEVFMQIRWRLAIVCKTCGFDPVLYLKKPELAAKKVKAHLDQRKEDINYLLSRPLNLPTITPARLKEIENSQKKNPPGSGLYLSKTL